MHDKKIVLFDGVCNFCNYWVRFIFKLNHKKDIFFLPLQDERTKELLPKEILDQEMETVIYYRAGQIFTHSSAALQIGTELNVLFRILSKIGLLVPKKLSDGVYSFIGKRRYVFGKKADCPLPTAALKQQFL